MNLSRVIGSAGDERRGEILDEQRDADVWAGRSLAGDQMLLERLLGSLMAR
jgi:hypothetical protein